jgi:hypothetical protein
MVHIHFGNLTIDEVKDSSGVFSGVNIQVKWRNVSKVNEGQGVISGDRNEIRNGVHIVNDGDAVDGQQPVVRRE